MTVCFFGNYLQDYPRVVVLRKGLAQNGVRVLECHTRRRGLGKYWALYRQHRRYRGQYDVLLVCMGGQTLVWFAKLLRPPKLVFDAFVSLYVTNVEDRQLCRPGSLRAWYYAFWDWFPCRLADKILLDTDVQIKYFQNHYRLPRQKFVRVWVGVDNAVFFPLPRPVAPPRRQFLVHWHGYLVPFHGFPIILQAAQKLLPHPEIKFAVITRFNSKFQQVKRLAQELGLANITFLPETTYQEVAVAIQRADVCLGIFGNNRKAQLVIPNKLYEALACAKLLITSRQEAAAELLTHQKTVLFCEPSSGADLAETILWARDHPAESAKIARAGYELFQSQLTPAAIGRQLQHVLF